ncbi:uncharacterized protein LOC123015478 [Tribolium madens]|uniref:uncharacterized protein LOC123015478 n=1 Tax=Tribolium madens TaxID=41895 RepID=UPI001CF72AE0|nr:uncharacterized protein LOC123015478 [Tribolium madens]
MEVTHSRKKSRKKRRKKPIYLELKRSTALFFTITKLLTLLAILMLVTSTRQPFYNILLIEKKDIPYLKNIENTIIILVIMIITCSLLVSLLAVYGYGCSSRYVLFFYGIVLIYSIIFFAYIGVVACLVRDDTDIKKKQLFLNYETNRQLKRAVHIIQTTYNCCGSPDFRYKNYYNLPESCCPVNTTACFHHNAYKNVCNITRLTVCKAIKDAYLTGYVMLLFIPLTAASLVQIGLVLNLVYEFSKSKRKQTDENIEYHL